MQDYIMSVRAIENGAFVADVGTTSYLVVPPGHDPTPADAIAKTNWRQMVIKDAEWKNDTGEPRGDILFVVHGYNMGEAEVMQRHRRLRDDLVAEGYKGVVISFDWPSDDKALAYLPDRHRAKLTSLQLVTDGITYLSGVQTPDCCINVHTLGHSTGAYVIREAFDDADDTSLPNPCWNVSQVVFAAGDVSSSSMSADDSCSESIYRHGIRFTNYFSRHDQALDLSNVKRVGTAPRVGRIGLPSGAPQKAVDVDCTTYYAQLTAPDSAIMTTDSPNGFVGMQSHSWYFGNKMFTRDLFNTIIGKDRNVIPTREVTTDGHLLLKHIP
ncbi:MAG: alpha/beta hydrolase [Desulfuromonadales bacterium]|nr:alpha/beta hydrolase [Desulfuromonadales bacterium]